MSQIIKPEVDEAFSVVDLAEIEKKFEVWTENLPLIKIFYAVKCNPDL